MEMETMEYALDQDVIFEYGDESLTGHITGQAGENFIVTLDHKLSDGTKTVLVPALAARPLACHWCRDERKVTASSFTMGQAETGSIPEVDCPYCCKK